MSTPPVLKSALYFSIFKAFTEAGIHIPFPPRDLHLKSAVPIVVTGGAVIRA